MKNSVSNAKSFKVTLNLTTGALFLCLGILLPLVFHSVVKAGAILCPMHIPVLLCGFICGPVIAAAVGMLTPILSSLTTGMPAMYPVAVSMMFELAVYGLSAGIFYRFFSSSKKTRKISILVSLVIAMFLGRISGGAASAIFYKSASLDYSFTIFLTGAFVTALPGIVIQFMVIPSAIYALEKAHIMQKYRFSPPFQKRTEKIGETA